MSQVASKQFQTTNYNNEQETVVLPSRLPHSSEFLLNRELSLIEFFRRVLEEALDNNQPLLERLKFLSIFSSNLDEFFMVRVSSLMEELDHKMETSPDGLTTAQQLKEIRARLLPLINEQMLCLQTDVLPKLAQEGIVIESYASLTDEERQYLQNYFNRNIYPILTPQAVDPSHPFPYVSGESLNLGLMFKPKTTLNFRAKVNKNNEMLFARIKVPQNSPRLIPVEPNGTRFVLLEDLIASNVSKLIPGARPEDCYPFRVTRDGDIELKEEEAADLLQMMEQNLRQRKFGTAVRLEVSASTPDAIVSYLTHSLELKQSDVYEIDGPLNLSDLMQLYKLDRPELKDKPLRVTRPAAFNGDESIFDVIKQQDVLLHHPYMPYSIVTDFIKEAAHDPNVLAIKMCLYRTGANSPIPPALIEASEQGKQVTVLIELKARFDEENNINWARRLERAGVHVVYGLLGLKTHCKTTLVVRQEGDELRRYVHLATGNYNPETSAFYTDLGLLTANEEIGADATKLFNFLTAYSQGDDYQQLMVAPINLRENIISLIQRETANARAGKPARIIAKINRLADTEVIKALYEASQAGVPIDLIVRGVCMLRPGVKGLSETITVRSIVGRLLEHSRIYYFAADGAEEVYMGSSDWMPRNLNRRVEVVTPIHDLHLKQYLKDDVLAAYLRDNVKARRLLPDGNYERVLPADGAQLFDSQMSFQQGSNLKVMKGNFRKNI